MKIRRKVLEDAFTLAILFLATEAFQSLIVDPRDPLASTNGSPILRVLWLLIYGVVAVRLIPQRHRVAKLVRANWILMLFVLLTIVSTIWSQDPGFTLRHAIALLGTTLIGIDFALRYSVKEQLRMLYIVFGLVVLCGIGANLLFPGFVPTADFDLEAWNGASSGKNEWARIVVLATIIFFSRSLRSRRDFVFIACLTLVAFGLIGLAKSAGALVILCALLVLFKLFNALRWKRKVLIAACMASALVVLPTSYLVFQNFDKVTALLGRDSTLTGRAAIWPLALADVAKNPIHGYGYRAFWKADSQPATRIREEIGWNAPGAHNGYIDLALGLGLPGAFLFLAGFFISVRRAIGFLQKSVDREAMWPLAYLSFFFIYQFVESTIVQGNTIYWILYVAASLSVTSVTSAEKSELKENREFLAPIQIFPSSQELA